MSFRLSSSCSFLATENDEKSPSLKPTVDLDNPPPTVEVLEMGVWRAYRERFALGQWQLKDLGNVVMTHLEDWRRSRIRSTQVVVTFLIDIFWLVGFYTWIKYTMATLLVSAAPSIKVYLRSLVINTLSQGFIGGHSLPVMTIALVIGAEAFFGVFETIVLHYREDMEKAMERCINEHFEKLIIEASTRLSLTRLRSSHLDTESRNVWGMFISFRDLVEASLSTVSSVGLLIASISNHSIGIHIILLSLLDPILTYSFKPGRFWDRGYVYHAINPFYIQAHNLYNLAVRSYNREHVVLNNIGDYTCREHKRAQSKYSDQSTVTPESQYRLSERRQWDVILELANRSPQIFYVASSLLNHGAISLAAFHMIETFRVNIHLSIMKVKYTVDFWTVRLNDVTALYNELNSSKSLPDGHLPYAAGEESKGMEFELKNVTYKHIGADSRLHLALSNVSLKIPGSSLVVIVGTNGSGKSTLLSMLGRMHNPTSGKILLNGKPYSDYRDRDIRRAIARMNPIVGCLTINENVKIGDEDSDQVTGDSLYKDMNEATRLGLADSFMGPISPGLSPKSRWEERLAPSGTRYTCGLGMSEDLSRIDTALSAAHGFSDGEEQRIGASRLFMRLLRKDIRLVLLDEPNSVLDPAAERQLFENILSMRRGKTIVIVLNKFEDTMMKSADLILCMKDGKLAESGTHDELLQTYGEYARLYGRTFFDHASVSRRF